MRAMLCLLLVGCAARQTAEIRLKQVEPSPAVEVRLNGKGPYLFAIDTGVNETVVDEKLLQASRIDRLELGGLELTQLPCTRAALTGVQGFIGLDVLLRFNSTLDGTKGTLTLRRRGAPHGQAGTEIPFDVESGRLVARGKLNDREILWWINTGFSPAAVHASLEAYQQADVGVSTAAEAAKRGETKVTIVLLRSVSVGSFSKTIVPGLAGTFPAGLGKIEGILTGAYFAGMALTFDADRRVLLVK